MCEVIKKICGKIGCGAYGCGKVSLLPSGERTEQELAHGGRLVRIGAVVRTCGYDSEEALLEALDNAAGKLEKISESENAPNGGGASEAEILGIRTELPGVIAERREDGFRAFEARCRIWFLEK